MIFGKFIYTQRSSQPIGIGRIALIRETPMRKLIAMKANSAERSFGAIASRSPQLEE